MKKISAGISIAALAVLVLSIGMSSPPQEANATDEDGCKKVTSERTADRGFSHQAVIKTDDKKYRIDADYRVGINDESSDGCNTYGIIKFDDAKDAKNLKLHTGEDMTIKFDCVMKECGGDFNAIQVVLVDKDEKDRDIALNLVQNPKPSSFETIEESECDRPLSDCKVEATIPKNIDKGKYKLVVEAVEDEFSTFFINKVKIKG
jgi:hypothetical protein